MRFNKVLLIQARYDSVFSNVLPAGIGTLSEFLSCHEIDNDVFDLNLDNSGFAKLVSKVKAYKPDVIGMSMMSLNYKYNYGILNSLKNIFLDIKIAAGGAHISTMRESVLKDCAAIDYGIVLEGEYTLLELVSGQKRPSDIKGLIYREGDKIIYNGDRPFIENLDSIPFSRYEKFEKRNYSRLISLFSSRGCPFECTYCPVRLTIGKRFIARSPKNVIDEMEYHYNKGHREFSFRDDNFTLIQDRVYEICDEIEKRNLADLYLMCDNGVRADKIDYRILRRMKEVGFKMIGLGIESGDDSILKSLKKNATVRIMEDAIKTTCDLGYIVELYFLIGSPGEGWKEFEKTVKLATKYPVKIVSFYHLLPYPGTELFDYVLGKGYLLTKPEVYLNDGSQRKNTPFFQTPEFSYKERKRAYKIALSAVKKSPIIKTARKKIYETNIKDKLSSLGIKGKPKDLISKIYCNDFMHEYIFNNKLVSIFKKQIFK